VAGTYDHLPAAVTAGRGCLPATGAPGYPPAGGVYGHLPAVATTTVLGHPRSAGTYNTTSSAVCGVTSTSAARTHRIVTVCANNLTGLTARGGLTTHLGHLLAVGAHR
jgi:hypothetical protein